MSKAVLNSMETFGSVYTKEQKEVDSIEQEYKVLVANATTDAKRNQLIQEMYKKIDKVNNGIFRNLPKITDLNSLYRWWLIDKEIPINSTLVNLVNDNIVSLIMRGIIEEVVIPTTHTSPTGGAILYGDESECHLRKVDGTKIALDKVPELRGLAIFNTATKEFYPFKVQSDYTVSATGNHIVFIG